MIQEEELGNLTPDQLLNLTEDSVEQIAEYYLKTLEQHIGNTFYKVMREVSSTTDNVALPKAAFTLRVKDVIKKGLGTYVRNQKWTANVKLTPYLIRTITNLGRLEVEKSNGREYRKKSLTCPACKTAFGSIDFLDVYDKTCHCKNCENNIISIEKELLDLKTSI